MKITLGDKVKFIKEPTKFAKKNEIYTIQHIGYNFFSESNEPIIFVLKESIGMFDPKDFVLER